MTHHSGIDLTGPGSLLTPSVPADRASPQVANAHVLRQRAEAQFSQESVSQTDALSEPVSPHVQQLVHDLQVHQIELELQNDELRQSHLALDSARARYFDLYDLAPVGYVTLREDGLIAEANLTAATLLGVPRSGLWNRPLHGFFVKEDQDGFYLLRKQLRESGEPQSRELRMTRRDGVQLWVHVMATVTTDHTGACEMRMVLSDITALKTLEGKLERMAHFDALTNLPNRLLKADRLQQAMAQARRSGQGLAMVYIDLDGFKSINDKHGHTAGDQMLVAVAGQMQLVLREGDTLARLGGDEFVAVLVNVSDITACAPLLERLLVAAAQPMAFNGEVLKVSASLGVTFYPQAQEVEGDQLLRQADLAMYQAKQAGKNRWHAFDTVHDTCLRGWHQDLHLIGQGFHRHEFVLHYQPKVNLRTGQVVGAEALIRWQHPTRGLLLPSNFLPVVEDHALAVDIGEWVMDTALSQMASWQSQGVHVPVSINVGARQLQQANFVQRLRAHLDHHPGVNPADLTLEILETSALRDIPFVSQVIDECHEMGVAFALDDFGTGYSSLTYLKRLRVTVLKIDQSFVHDMLNNPNDLAILKGIIGLAAAFKHEVIAEGVETESHGALLLQLGCELAQGFCLARPMPAQELPGWIQGWGAKLKAKLAPSPLLAS